MQRATQHKKKQLLKQLEGTSKRGKNRGLTSKRVSFQPNPNGHHGRSRNGPPRSGPAALRLRRVRFANLLGRVSAPAERNAATALQCLPKEISLERAAPNKEGRCEWQRWQRAGKQHGGNKQHIPSISTPLALSRPVGWLVGRFPSFFIFVFQFKNWCIVIVLFSYSHLFYTCHLTNRPNHHQ